MESLEFETQRLRSLQAMQAGLLELKWLRDALRFDRAMRDHLFALKYGYNPNQPRVPKEEDGAGQWTALGGNQVAGGGPAVGWRVRISRTDFPGATNGQLVRLEQNIARTEATLREIRQYDPTWRPRTASLTTPGSVDGAIRNAEARAVEAEGRLQQLRSGIGGNFGPSLNEGPSNPQAPAFDGQAWINAYRAANNSPDLFGRPVWRPDSGTVAVANIEGTLYYGVNSKAPGYSVADQKEADNWRWTMINKYPSEFESRNIGTVPNDSFYHAESNILLRVARESGGTLEGRDIEVHTDRPMCPTSCPVVLPKLGLELGNPRVTFIDQNGMRRTMRDGKWQ